MAVDIDRVPVAGLEAGDLVRRIGKRNRAVDGDRVVVPEQHELVELQVAGKRNRLLADAFHQAAVAAQRVGVVVHQLVAEFIGELAFGDRHAERVGNALAERTGGGLDAGGVAVFGMAGGLGAELAEILDILDRHVLVAEEIEQRVEQHRTMAGREHEAVAVRPVRVLGIKAHEAGEQHRGDIGRAHRQAGMAGIGLLHGVHGEEADRVGHPVMFIKRSHVLLRFS